jgi:hypothetical protein
MAIWNILQTFGIFYDHLVQFVFIWYIFPVLVSDTMKNLATLTATKKRSLLSSATSLQCFPPPAHLATRGKRRAESQCDDAFLENDNAFLVKRRFES